MTLLFLSQHVKAPSGDRVGLHRLLAKTSLSISDNYVNMGSKMMRCFLKRSCETAACT